MAVRRPLKLDGSNNLIEMNDTDIANIKTEMIRQYSLNPSVTLSVSAGAGNLGTIADTRLQAGAASQSTTAFPLETTTAEPSTVTVNYNNFVEAATTLSAPADTNNVAFPIYVTAAGHIQAMTLTDMRDTFVNDVITTLTTAATGTAQGGTYRIHTTTTLAGHTLISATPVFTNTIADLDSDGAGPDTSAYTAAGIPETLDQPATKNNYYLFRIDGATVGTIPTPLFIRSADNNLQQFTTANFQTQLQNLVRYYAANVTGDRIDYTLSTSATNSRGSGMVNTNHTGGSGDYQTRFVNADLYYAQEFPNGTVSTITTTYLNCVRA
jgi:hypothetical protein